MTQLISRAPKSKPGEPVWALAALYPAQGHWTEQDYLALSDHNILIEFTDGQIEVLPMPNIMHQEVVSALAMRLRAHADANEEGRVLFAPLPLRLREALWREPDIILFSREDVTPDGKYPTAARLVVEVVSPDEESIERDYEQKRRTYAEAAIPEYWIVDPQQKVVMVLTLAGGQYQEYGTFRPGDRATSLLLSGFTVDVADLFAAGR